MAFFGRKDGGAWKEFPAFGIVDAVTERCNPLTGLGYTQIAADIEGKRVLAVIQDDKWVFPDKEARISFYTANSVIQEPGNGWYYIYIAYPIKDDFKQAVSKRYWVGADGYKPNWRFPKSSLKEVKEFIRRKGM